MPKNYWICNKCGIIKIQGNKYPSFSIFGGLRSYDVGKRLYLINDILYIENTEQYDKRIRR
jgi:hypothetical protein